jgi:protein-disulfide isomerase
MSNDLIVLPPRSPLNRSRSVLMLAIVVIAAVTLLIYVGKCLKGARTSHAPARPPWVYGTPTARFTLVEFADLQCAYCRMYFPTLRAWIDAHPDVNWEWRHLPMAAHEPEATEAARLAECAGEVGGSPLFWWTVEWLYQHPSEQIAHPEGLYQAPAAHAIHTCLQTDRPGSIVRQQLIAATQEAITATPTLRLLDRRGGRAVTIAGMVSPDVLSSAVDALATSD